MSFLERMSDRHALHHGGGRAILPEQPPARARLHALRGRAREQCTKVAYSGGPTTTATTTTTTTTTTPRIKFPQTRPYSSMLPRGGCSLARRTPAATSFGSSQRGVS